MKTTLVENHWAGPVSGPIFQCPPYQNVMGLIRKTSSAVWSCSHRVSTLMRTIWSCPDIQSVETQCLFLFFFPLLLSFCHFPAPLSLTLTSTFEFIDE